MLFNSFEYVIFLPIVFILYWFVFNKSLQLQNFFLLVVSYIFYGWWDWRFLSLIAFSSVVDYMVAKYLSKEEDDKIRKRLLFVSLFTNLGLLGVLKYFNFFSASLSEAFNSIGYDIDAFTLNVILPVGISFYTFQTLSYTIDVYKRNMKASNDVVSFFAYVSFFPQLVAGPIERASNLLPQFYKKRKFTYNEGSKGLKQILWGLFKKVVIADNLSGIVNEIFDKHETLPGGVLILGAIFFAFQIYGDFSGYSDIAIGTARLFGFKLMTNFRMPYFSRDMAEFWRRWHISLSTWFRDYLYIPLGGSKRGKKYMIRNTFIIFIVSGFWHGANYTFLAWGFLNALYFLPLFFRGKNRKNLNVVAENSYLPSLKEAFQMLSTFTLTIIAWVFFRAETITDAFNYLGGVVSNKFLPDNLYYLNPKILLILGILLVVEWRNRRTDFVFEHTSFNRGLRWVGYMAIATIIVLFAQKEQHDFIYFQF